MLGFILFKSYSFLSLSAFLPRKHVHARRSVNNNMIQQLRTSSSYYHKRTPYSNAKCLKIAFLLSISHSTRISGVAQYNRTFLKFVYLSKRERVYYFLIYIFFCFFFIWYLSYFMLLINVYLKIPLFVFEELLHIEYQSLCY